MTNELLPWNAAHFDKFFVGADKVLKNLHAAHETYAKSVPGYPRTTL